MVTPTRRPLYIFIDEGGNFDFSPKGSKYFTLTGVRLTRPFGFDPHLTELRFDILEEGLSLEYFHATEDRQYVRDRVLHVIGNGLRSIHVDCVVVEKRKTSPSMREDVRFYPEMMGYLLQYVFRGIHTDGVSEVIVITDRIPVSKKRNVVEKAVKTTLERMLPGGLPYRVIHHDSKSCSGLQVADYINWAIQRKWEREDARSYALVKHAIKTEFDIFQNGATYWY